MYTCLSVTAIEYIRYMFHFEGKFVGLLCIYLNELYYDHRRHCNIYYLAKIAINLQTPFQNAVYNFCSSTWLQLKPRQQFYLVLLFKVTAGPVQSSPLHSNAPNQRNLTH